MYTTSPAWSWSELVELVFKLNSLEGLFVPLRSAWRKTPVFIVVLLNVRAILEFLRVLMRFLWGKEHFQNTVVLCL